MVWWFRKPRSQIGQKVKKIIAYTTALLGATAAIIFAGPAGATAMGVASAALKVLGVLADQIGGVSDGDATEEREALVGQTSHLGHSVSDMLKSCCCDLPRQRVGRSGRVVGEAGF